MDPLVEFAIPMSGLKIGTHSFDFQIDNEFFSHFPDSLIEEGTFEVQLGFEKKVDFYELTFTFKGTIKTPCDRCLAAIDFPVNGVNRLIIKLAETFSEDVDVIYVPLKTEKLNVAKYIYEYISLAVPYIKTYNCESEEQKPCDEQLLAMLSIEAKAKQTIKAPNPVWDKLKNIKFD